MGFGATQILLYIPILSFTRYVTFFAPLGLSYPISQNRNNSLVLSSLFLGLSVAMAIKRQAHSR